MDRVLITALCGCNTCSVAKVQSQQHEHYLVSSDIL